MKVRITTSHRATADPALLFDFTNQAENLVSFVGCGPIPGIRAAAYETAGEPAVGSRRRVHNTDGTEHREEIVVFDRPRLHVTRITGLVPPLSWLVRYGEDHWRFTPEGSGTRIDRTFVFELTTVLVAPLALVILHTFMKTAVRRDLENVCRAVSDLPVHAIQR